MRIGNEFDELTSLLSEAIAQAKRLMNRFKIAPRTKRHKSFAQIVLCELVRKAESVEAMANAKAYSGVNIVVRAAFENYVDLLNLLKYPNHYPDYMTYLSFEQNRSYLQAMLDSPSSPFAKSISHFSVTTYGEPLGITLANTKKDLDAIRQALPSQFLEKRRKSSTPKVNTSTKLRFKVAERENEYDGAYKLLSYHTHGALAVLLDGIRKGNELQWPPAETAIVFLA